jgi:hypothetical protein
MGQRGPAAGRCPEQPAAVFASHTSRGDDRTLYAMALTGSVLNRAASRRTSRRMPSVCSDRSTWCRAPPSERVLDGDTELGVVHVGQRVEPLFVAARDRIWLVTFMHYDLGYFDDETCRLEPIANPFGPTLLRMSSE